MSLEKRVYSVLVVSAADGFTSALKSLLPESHYSPVKTVSSVNAAKRTVAENTFDYVIINSPLPDGLGTHFAVDCCSSSGTVVLLFVKNELHDEIYEKVNRHGVFTLAKPTSKSAVTTALYWMSSARERLRKFEKKTVSVEEKMEEIRVVNRAKWLLITQLNLSEPDAHRRIEKLAMDKCLSKRAIAEEIIEMYS